MGRYPRRGLHPRHASRRRSLPKASTRRPTLAFFALSIALLLTLPVPADAQALASNSDEAAGAASSNANGAGPAGIVPTGRGLNLSLGTSSQHDSSSGWSTVLTPALAYRLNRFISADVSVPLYASINIYLNSGTAHKPLYTYATKHGVLGDTSLAAHLDLHTFVDYTATASLGLPSGNSTYGLGAGQPIFDFNNHFEKSFGRVSPDIEAGFGDSSNLVDRRVRKSYTEIGYNAHFQAGASIELPRSLSFSVDAYEQLPLSTTTVLSTTGRGKKKVTTSTKKTLGGEDNGITTSLDIPFHPHITLSGFYNRSLRNHDDVAGCSFTFLLKARPARDSTPR